MCTVQRGPPRTPVGISPSPLGRALFEDTDDRISNALRLIWLALYQCPEINNILLVLSPLQFSFCLYAFTGRGCDYSRPVDGWFCVIVCASCNSLVLPQSASVMRAKQSSCSSITLSSLDRLCVYVSESSHQLSAGISRKEQMLCPRRMHL